MENLRYPIGYFECPEKISSENIKEWIQILEDLPRQLESLVERLTEEQLETPYRPKGWTVRQVVHHIADSHHNSYTRFKWALTEENPLIKVYQEKGWSNLFDAKNAPIELSLNYLKALHSKLVYLLRGISLEDLNKKFIHPEGNTKVTVAENIGKYAWHGKHHFTHIQNLIKREDW